MTPHPLIAFSDWTGLLCVFLIFGGGGIISEVIKNLNRTRVELATLRAQQQGVQGLERDVGAVKQEVAALRQELTEFRDTATQYDLSFDTAMQRMESRVDHIEKSAQAQRVPAQSHSSVIGGG